MTDPMENLSAALCFADQGGEISPPEKCKNCPWASACGKPMPETPMPENPRKTENCLCDLIESIALVETALSRVISAEGEKIQKALEASCTKEDLLELNRSVQSTLQYAAVLEQTLFLKLDAVKDFLCK